MTALPSIRVIGIPHNKLLDGVAEAKNWYGNSGFRNINITDQDDLSIMTTSIDNLYEAVVSGKMLDLLPKFFKTIVDENNQLVIIRNEKPINSADKISNFKQRLNNARFKKH